MKILESIFLGIIQGATEFLPVSSSGHLVVIPALLGLQLPNLAFTMGLHFGTLLALIAYFFSDVYKLVKGFFSIFSKNKTEEDLFYIRLLLLIIIAVIPAGIAGVLLSKKVDTLFSNPKTVSYLFFVTAFFMFLSSILSKRATKTIKDITFLDALIVGIFQIFALPPGISRSGSTITGGIVSSIKKEDASRFSFLVAIPVILGASLLELKGGNFASFSLLDVIVGMITSFIVGLISLKIFFPLIKKTSFYVFAIYCVVIGFIGLIFLK